MCGPRRIYIDMGANWCNTLRLYADIVPSGMSSNALPWQVFGFEASPLIQPFADRFTAWLNGEAAEPLLCLPRAGSGRHLQAYFRAYGCPTEGSQKEQLLCMFRRLDKPLRALRPEPRLNSTSLVQQRLSEAAACPSERGTTPRYSFVPAAVGVRNGWMGVTSVPQQLIRGGSIAREYRSAQQQARSNFLAWSGDLKQYEYRVPVVDVVSWMRASFSRDDFVVVKLDAEGAEWEILDEMIEQQMLDVIDVLSLEMHGDMGTRHTRHFKKTKSSLLHELQRRAPRMHIANETYEGATHRGYDSFSEPPPEAEMARTVRLCEAKFR